MSQFDRLSNAFDEKTQKETQAKKEPNDRAATIKYSKAIIRAIDKLKAAGVQVTKKAELDYLLACRFLERNHIELDSPQEEEIIQARTPQEFPDEFQTAMNWSLQVVAEVEDMMKNKQEVSSKKKEEYQICKQFLKKYA